MTKDSLTLHRRGVLAASLAGLVLPGGVAQAQASARDTLTFIEGSDFDTLDPAISRTRSAEILFFLMFRRLVKWKDTDLSAIEGDLAESWTTSDDGLSWTFRLRPNIRFHDNTPLAAEAVKFNFDRLRDQRFGSPNRSLYAPITAVTVLDPLTIRFTTEVPHAGLLETLVESSAAISSPTAVQRAGRNYARQPVGTGPYRLEEWAPGERTVLIRANDGARFRRIIYRPVPEGEARLIELEAGTADIATGIPPEAVPRVRASQRLKLEVIPSSFQIVFELNNARPPFNDVRVRRAIQYAVDRDAIVQRILGGFGAVPDSNMTPGVQSYEPLSRWPYDPDRAKREIEAVFPGGFREKLVLWTSSGRYLKDQQVAEAVQGYLNAIGLQTEFRTWEWASYQQTLYRRQPAPNSTGFGSNAAHMWILGTSIPTADWRLTRKVGTGQSANVTGYSNARVDELLTRARATLDQDARMALYRQVNRILWQEDPPHLYLYNQAQLVAMQRNISNFRAFAFELPLLADVTKG
jgi:ABC-type transport system substrate-binding protein